MLLKIVYGLTWRSLGLVVVLVRGDRAIAAEMLVLRHENAVLRRQAGRVRNRWERRHGWNHGCRGQLGWEVDGLQGWRGIAAMARGWKGLYYSSQINLMAVEVTTGSAVQAGVPRKLFKGPLIPWFDVSADGRFLFSSQEAAKVQSPIRVVLNWQSALK